MRSAIRSLAFLISLAAIFSGPAFAEAIEQDGKVEGEVSPSAVLWVGLAAGLYHNNTDAFATSGLGQSLDRTTSEIRAVERCRANSSPASGNCSSVASFNSGCGYVSVGTKKVNGVASARYGTGNSAQAAWDKCSIGGFNCTKPLGGCIKK